MRDKEEVRKEVDHIPTHSETVAKFFAEHENLESIVAWVKASFEGGYPDAAKIFLREAEDSIEVIRVLVGASTTDGARQVEKEKVAKQEEI